MLDKTFGGLSMSKYSYEEKLEAVLRVKNEGISQRKSAGILGCNYSLVGEWIALYEKRGADALLNGGASYDGEFKVMVVEYMHANHLSYRATATEFGIKCHSNVIKWERIYYEEGPDGLLRKKSRGRPPKMNNQPRNNKKHSKETEEDLRAEVQRLRMENEYLKKLNALVQERIARENGNEPPSSTN